MRSPRRQSTSTCSSQPATAVRAARDAGLGVWRLTVQRLADNARIATVERARDLQAAVGGFRAFAPLPRTVSVTEPTTGYDDVKQVALARVVVTNIDSIQVDWPIYGPKLAQVALTVGADDVDGIAAVDPGRARHAAQPDRGNQRQHPRRGARGGRAGWALPADSPDGRHSPGRGRLLERAPPRCRSRSAYRTSSRCDSIRRRSARCCCTRGRSTSA